MFHRHSKVVQRQSTKKRRNTWNLTIGRYWLCIEDLVVGDLGAKPSSNFPLDEIYVPTCQKHWPYVLTFVPDIHRTRAATYICTRETRSQLTSCYRYLLSRRNLRFPGSMVDKLSLPPQWQIIKYATDNLY